MNEHMRFDIQKRLGKGSYIKSKWLEQGSSFEEIKIACISEQTLVTRNNLDNLILRMN